METVLLREIKLMDQSAIFPSTCGYIGKCFTPKLKPIKAYPAIPIATAISGRLGRYEATTTFPIMPGDHCGGAIRPDSVGNLYKSRPHHN